MNVGDIQPQIPFVAGETLSLPGKKIQSTRKAARLVSEYIGHQDQEYAVVITTDIKLAVLGIHIVGIGSSYEVVTHVRDIMRGAITDGAHGIVFIHNHTGGRMKASKSDKRMVKLLMKAGKFLDVAVLDVIIVHRNKWVSVI